MEKVKAGVNFYPGVNTSFEKMGDISEFGLEIVKASDGVAAVNAATGTWSEVMWSDPGHSATLADNATIGDATITLVSGNTLEVGDRFDDGAGNKYYVTASSDTEISIKGKVVANIADADTLASVANTGIYKIDVNLVGLGEYFVSMTHPEFGSTTIKYEMVERTLVETYDRLDTGLNGLGASGSMVAIS